MCKIMLPLGIAGMLFGLFPPAADAQTLVTYVSTSGNNTNTCGTPAAACDTFQRAINHTLAGGTVRVLTPGSFGAASITAALSIIADGVEGGIIGAATGSPASGVFINAGPNDVVNLRGLLVDPSGSQHGISFISGAALRLENCVIRRGVLALNFAPSAASELYVSNCTITDPNPPGNSPGIFIQPTGAGSAKVVLDRVHVENRLRGIMIDHASGTGTIDVTVRDSVTAGNTAEGIWANTSGGIRVTVMVDRTASVNNGTGVFANGVGAIVRIGDSTVTGNGVGFSSATGGQIVSYQTNKLVANVTDGAPSSTVPYK